MNLNMGIAARDGRYTSDSRAKVTLRKQGKDGKIEVALRDVGFGGDKKSGMVN